MDFEIADLAAKSERRLSTTVERSLQLVDIQLPGLEGDIRRLQQEYDQTCSLDHDSIEAGTVALEQVERGMKQVFLTASESIRRVMRLASDADVDAEALRPLIVHLENQNAERAIELCDASVVAFDRIKEQLLGKLEVSHEAEASNQDAKSTGVEQTPEDVIDNYLKEASQFMESLYFEGMLLNHGMLQTNSQGEFGQTVTALARLSVETENPEASRILADMATNQRARARLRNSIRSMTDDVATAFLLVDEDTEALFEFDRAVDVNQSKVGDAWRAVRPLLRKVRLQLRLRRQDAPHTTDAPAKQGGPTSHNSGAYADEPHDWDQFEEDTPALDKQSVDWVKCAKENEKVLGYTASTLRTYCNDSERGTTSHDKMRGYLNCGPRWRRQGTPRATRWFYLPSIPPKASIETSN